MYKICSLSWALINSTFMSGQHKERPRNTFNLTFYFGESTLFVLFPPAKVNSTFLFVFQHSSIRIALLPVNHQITWFIARDVDKVFLFTCLTVKKEVLRIITPMLTNADHPSINKNNLLWFFWLFLLPSHLKSPKHSSNFLTFQKLNYCICDDNSNW